MLLKTCFEKGGLSLKFYLGVELPSKKMAQPVYFNQMQNEGG
jgi:hypothetical protein